MSPDVTSYPIKIKISVDFRCVANHMQMWLGKKMVISHFGYWHFLSTANTAIPALKHCTLCKLNTRCQNFSKNFSNRIRMKWAIFRRPSIDASYQVSVHLAKRFQRRLFRNRPIRKTKITYCGHVCKRINPKSTIAIEDLPYMLSTKFRFIWPSGFRGEDFF